MTKYVVVEDTSFLPCGGVEDVWEFDTAEEADWYLSTKFCFLEWEHELHRVLYIVKREVV